MYFFLLFSFSSNSYISFAFEYISFNTSFVYVLSKNISILFLGSIPSYYLGYFGGRQFVEKYGKYFLISHKDLDDADKWVEKYGDWAFFICRMLPVVRTFISLPAGILKAKKRIFFSLTFLGSLVWSYLLVYVGVKFGQNMEMFKALWHKFDILIVVIVGILGVLYIYKHVKHLKES